MGGDRTGDAAQERGDRRAEALGLPPEIQLADLLRALGSFAPASDQVAADIAALLGLRPEAGAVAVVSPGPEGGVDGEGGGEEPSDPFATADGGSSRRIRDRSTAPGLVTSLTPVEVRPRTTSSWLDSVPTLPPSDSSPAGTATALPSLFTPRWARGILTIALETRRVDDGPIDVDEAVRQAASGRSITELPRLPWPTNRFGAQVLLDMGPGMLPFRGDQSQLQAFVSRLVGRDRTTVLRFAGCPSRGVGVGSRTSWRGYEPPRRGRPVVVVSDLGVAPTDSTDSAPVDEWLAFSADLRRAGCLLVAFVPYPTGRVPAELRRSIAVVPWDRSTSVRVGRQVVGRTRGGR